MSYYCFNFSKNEKGENVVHKSFTCSELPKQYDRIGLGYCDTAEESIKKALRGYPDYKYVMCDVCGKFLK